MRTEDRATAEEPVETEGREGRRRELKTGDIAESPRAATERPRADETKAHNAAPLFAAKDAEGYRARWQDVQARFVDAPRESVEAADTLVAEVIKATVFADQQKQLESAIEREGKLSTEELRIALQRYRSFFDRLLSV